MNTKLAILLMSFVLLVSPAVARWQPQYAQNPPRIQKWYQQQRNGHGSSCCAEADGHDYYGPVTFNSDGSVTLVNGHVLPAYMVLMGTNPTGHAVWWYIEGPSGHTDYCFIPGSLM